ncbi:MAG: type II toxin-antitoxin system RelE/ParE family toxin [Cyanobacteria bacterium P01_F01_bin.4]
MPKAIEDIKDILKYTQMTWGPTQRTLYKQAIDKCIQSVGQTPQPRTKADECVPGYLRRHIGKGYRHYVFYRIGEDVVVVVRLLHDSMDFMRHLK